MKPRCANASSRMRIEPHHTRLFPKFLGAQAYRLTGIAARCDCR